jgi:hypothetical protein
MVWKLIKLRLRGRLQINWEDDVKQDVKVMRIYHWKSKLRV